MYIIPDACTPILFTCISQIHWSFHCKRRIQQYENWLSNSTVSADMQTELHAGHLAAESYCSSTWDKWCFSPSCKSETRKWSFFLQHKAWCSKVRNILHAAVRTAVCIDGLFPLSCAVSVPLSHLLFLQDEVAMEPLSITVVLVSLSSFLVSQWIFYVACPWLSERLIPAFLTLTHKQRTEWSSRSIFFYYYVFFVCFLQECKTMCICV